MFRLPNYVGGSFHMITLISGDNSVKISTKRSTLRYHVTENFIIVAPARQFNHGSNLGGTASFTFLHTRYSMYSRTIWLYNRKSLQKCPFWLRELLSSYLAHDVHACAVRLARSVSQRMFTTTPFYVISKLSLNKKNWRTRSVRT